MSLLLPVLAFMLQSATPDCEMSGDRPLFECDVPLEFTLEVPMKTLLRRADDRPVLDGKLHYTDQHGNQLEFDIQVTTRGPGDLQVSSVVRDLRKKAGKGHGFRRAEETEDRDAMPQRCQLS
jgi:hypothetical protein